MIVIISKLLGISCVSLICDNVLTLTIQHCVYSTELISYLWHVTFMVKDLYCHSLCVEYQKSQVWEITGAEFTKSNVHTAGGISIRFPRLSRIRDDKSVRQATDLPQLLVSHLTLHYIVIIAFLFGDKSWHLAATDSALSVKFIIVVGRQFQ